MKQLYKMLSIRKKIEEKKARLSEICTPTPKGQILTGMPRGGEARNAAEDYVERKEKLCAEIKSLYNRLERMWREFECLCNHCDLHDYEIALLKFHYYYNYSWKKVQQKLQVHFPSKVWNKNRVFRTRRRAIDKVDPSRIISKYR